MSSKTFWTRVFERETDPVQNNSSTGVIQRQLAQALDGHTTHMTVTFGAHGHGGQYGEMLTAVGDYFELQDNDFLIVRIDINEAKEVTYVRWGDIVSVSVSRNRPNHWK